MADTLISKIQVRNGDIVDLPILSEAEMAYATDENRLFIGNIEYDVGTGTGSKTVFNIPSTSNIPIPNTNIGFVKFYVDGIERSDVTVGGTTVTFSVAPDNGTAITMNYNSEIILLNSSVTPNALIMNASVVSSFEDTGFSFDTGIYDTMFMDYSVKLVDGTETVTGYRMGELRVMVDTVGSTFKIDDEYNSMNNDTAVEFDGRIDNGIFYLTYKNNTTSAGQLKYTFKLWKM